MLTRLTRLLAIALLLSMTAWSPTAHAALGEPVQTANTNWWWYYGQTPAQVSALIDTDNARFVSLRVASTNPLLLDVALVQNTDTYKKTWWWYYGLTAQELQDHLTANNARLESLEPYVVNGVTYFAAIMLHNVGADYSGWWWYYGVTPAQISSLLTQNDARLIDLRQYWNGSSTVYGVVMVSNTGTNQSGWWWYYNISASQVGEFLAQNNAYLISIDPANTAGTAFNVVMNSYAPGFRWYWYYGQTAAQVAALVQTDAARIFDLKSYVVGGTRYFAVLMLGNSWDATQAEEASCDRNVMSSWSTTLPAVGLGSSSVISSYDSAIRGLMLKYSVPGGAVAVMKDGKLVLARGYGLGDTDNRLIAHPDSLFRIASLSKQITSAAILQLVQEQKLSLDTKPFSLLGFTPNPNLPQTPALSSITIRELLQHTGGWSLETGCKNCDSEGDPMFESETIASAQHATEPPSCDRIIQYMLSQPVHWAPGTVYDYSNFGYCVLGAIIEKVTSTDYASAVTSNILSPAGAGGIVQGNTIWQADREVVYYDFPNAGSGQDVFATSLDAFTNPYGNFYLEAMAAHGAWVASPVDLLRFQGALDGRISGVGLLYTKTLQEMTANPNVLWSQIDSSKQLTTFTPSGYWYGMGWSVNTAGNWWHFGSLPGTATEQVHAKNGFGWAAFFNTRPSNSDGFLSDLDSTLWAAHDATSDWSSADLFDQYGPYTGWIDGATYQSQFNSAAAAGKYPSRVEGYSGTGTPLYRAVFAPFHGTAWQSHHGLACPAYQNYAATMGAQGYDTASLQSYIANDGTRRYQATWVK